MGGKVKEGFIKKRFNKNAITPKKLFELFDKKVF